MISVPKSLVYLDTSVINFLFADDAPAFRDITKLFFEQSVRPKLFDVMVSQYVVEEISQTKEEIQKLRLLQVIADYELRYIEDYAEEITTLAQEYLNAGIVPQKNIFDALHVAFCTIYKSNFLASWNFKHLANVSREQRFIMVNQSLGYLHEFRIVTPEILIGNGT